MALFKLKRKTHLKLDKSSLLDELVSAKTAADMYAILDRISNPDVILKAAAKDISVLRIVKSNYQVSSNVISRKAGLLKQNWRLKKEDCSDERYKFIERCLKKVKINELIKQILEAPLFGFVPIEIYWENNGKNIYPTKTVAKPQEWFHFDSLGNFYFRSKENTSGVLISEDSYKFLFPRHNPDYLNPYGEALLSKCYWYTLFMKFGFEFWFKFMEKYGMPWTIGKYDDSLSKEGQDKLFNGLINLFQDAVGLIPADGSVEFLESSGGSSDNYDLFIKRCENNCSKILLGQTLTTDIGSTGSYAASQTHQEVRQDIVEADKKLVEENINLLIEMIYKINFGEDENLPVFEIYEDKDIDTSLVDRDTKVQSLGVQFKKEYICKTYGYNEKDIEIFKTNTISNNLNQFSEENSMSNELEQSTKNYAEDLTLELESYLFNLSKNPIKECINKIIEFYSTSFDAEKAEDILAKNFPEISTDELEKILTKIIFISSLLGGQNDK